MGTTAVIVLGQTYNTWDLCPNCNERLYGSLSGDRSYLLCGEYSRPVPSQEPLAIGIIGEEEFLHMRAAIRRYCAESRIAQLIGACEDPSLQCCAIHLRVNFNHVDS